MLGVLYVDRVGRYANDQFAEMFSFVESKVRSCWGSNGREFRTIGRLMVWLCCTAASDGVRVVSTSMFAVAEHAVCAVAHRRQMTWLTWCQPGARLQYRPIFAGDAALMRPYRGDPPPRIVDAGTVSCINNVLVQIEA